MALPALSPEQRQAALQQAVLAYGGLDSIAVEPNGNLLIADSERNQIFERNQRGQLSVFAGTGQVGESGNGTRALDAEFEAIMRQALGLTW